MEACGKFPPGQCVMTKEGGKRHQCPCKKKETQASAKAAALPTETEPDQAHQHGGRSDQLLCNENGHRTTQRDEQCRQRGKQYLEKNQYTLIGCISPVA